MTSRSSSSIIRHGPCGTHVAPPHSHKTQVSTSTRKVHPPPNPKTRHGIHLTHELEGSLVFDAEHPFSFLHTYPLESRILEFAKEPRISPCGSILWAFQLTHDTTSRTSRVLNFWTPEGSTLTCSDVPNTGARIGGSRALHSPNGPSKQVSGVTCRKEDITHGPYSGWHVSCLNGHIGSTKPMNLGDTWHVQHGSMSPKVTSLCHVISN